MRAPRLTAFLIVLFCGLIPATIVQFISPEPVSRCIHIRNFRYGKDPSVIRCNRGDTLHISFSSDDTGHSFYLEEFDADAKVTPLKDEVEIFSVDDPSLPPVTGKELMIIAEHPGILNYLVSKSQFRCHVWCGPMHAFESGKLVIFPNTLMFFGLGALAGIFFLWVFRLKSQAVGLLSEPETDLFRKHPFLEKIISSRWPQLILTVIALLLIYVVLMTTLFGTKVSGRNLGVLLMWAVWLFVLVTVLTPAGGRIWCSICPLPVFGDLIQRGSFFTPLTGRTGGFNNSFRGLFLKWPSWLDNSWLRLILFMILATFSTTLVASPKTSGIAVLALILAPTIMAMVWELRAFCRYICPISVFVRPFSSLSPFGLRSKSADICSACKPKYCKTGNISGWACPYGLNTGELTRNDDCGLCFECVRSCSYKNVTLKSGTFGNPAFSRNISEAFTSIAIFITSLVYSFLYHGHWPLLRDYVNIIDKSNWDLFGIYAVVFWGLILALVPGIIYLLAIAGRSLSRGDQQVKELFLAYSSMLLPIGLMIWISFVVPMLFVNVTFIGQSLSDPFGWGWDFFGTANIPWKQFLPRFIPIIQAALLIAGLHLSMRRTRKIPGYARIPIGIFLTVVSGLMIVFFTN